MANLHGDPGLASDHPERATPFRRLPALNGEKPKRKILIAEDSAVVRLYLRHTLENGALHVEVHEAEDGMDAIAAMERCDYDLVICDLSMPNLDGRDFCTLVRSNRKMKPLPILIFTSSYQSRKDPQFAGDPAIYFLQKPATASEIVGRVDGLLAAPK